MGKVDIFPDLQPVFDNNRLYDPRHVSISFTVNKNLA